jgi:hypothetical protein
VKEQEVVNHLEKKINKRSDKFSELSEKETIQEAIKCLQSVSVIFGKKKGFGWGFQGDWYRGRVGKQAR